MGSYPFGVKKPPVFEQLLDTVRDYIEQFEVEHPRLTGTLNRVMVALSNLGI